MTTATATSSDPTLGRRRRRSPLLLAAAAAATVTACSAAIASSSSVTSSSSSAAFASLGGNAGTRTQSSNNYGPVVPRAAAGTNSRLPQNVLLAATKSTAESTASTSRGSGLFGTTTRNKDRQKNNHEQQPELLRMICDEPNQKKKDAEKESNEYRLAVGHALDTLRNDYPSMLSRSPDFSIYDPNIEVVDPSGVTLHGVRNYKTSFQFMRALVNFFYCPEKSMLTFRLLYDTVFHTIRVSWNAELVPRKLYGGTRNILHVDGISVYEIDTDTKLIHRHHIEHLLLNGEPQRPQEGVFAAVRNQAVSDGVPVCSRGVTSPELVNCLWSTEDSPNPFVLEFQSGPNPIGKALQNLMPSTSTSRSTSSLFSMADDNASPLNPSPEDTTDHPNFDEKAFQQKNLSRKKFGLKPLTMHEFQELQSQVRKMEAEQAAKARKLAAEAAAVAERRSEEQSKKKNALSSLFGSILQDTCETNYDCERPEVCCDLGFKKMCCSSGMKVFEGVPQRQLLRVPMSSGVQEEGQFPRGGPGGMGDGPVSGY